MAGEPLDLHRSCSRAREWVSLRLDGELSEIERLLLRRHLTRCEGCRDFADTAALTAEVIRTTPLERPTRALEPARPLARRQRARYRLAAAAAVLAVGAGVGGVLATAGDDSTGPGRSGTEIAQVTPPPAARTIQPPPGQNV